jgi:hypothetical protein
MSSLESGLGRTKIWEFRNFGQRSDRPSSLHNSLMDGHKQRK